MEQTQESMQDYVVRKLNERTLNLVQLSKDLNMNRSKIYRIKNKGETSYKALETLYNHFRKSAD